MSQAHVHATIHMQVSPVIYAASSEARKPTAAAISSGFP